MSATDTYTKYNLHSTAPYIGGNVRVCKSMRERRERETSEETSKGKCPGGNILHPTKMGLQAHTAFSGSREAM